MLMGAIIWPNTERFNTGVRDGSLDYTLLQPVNSLFLISFSRIVLWRAWDMVLATVLIIVGIQMSGGTTSLFSLLAFLLLMVSGAAILYSLWIVMIAFTFWFVKFDNNVTILQALLEAGRYPATVYPAWLRLIVTFVIPIAVATTIPLQALRGDLAPWQVLAFLVVSAVCVFIASRVWKAGIRRYAGASS
jgi:ABC-2 type transport system permease protein